ncbi:hypothetical protein XEUV354_21700 [Xanthomonas euvesicatoria]|nr:hypothetical protein XEU66b_18270 [Xanthomonas euvesicatoria]KLA49764.1 hypothetical protein XEUV683_21015 [Xanthomonas euvesicatoria]KLA51619.1 hypothetical protein XEUV684_22180 [Xanthomonas euvesicatoria]KLA54791.1 hypothetical protein XEUV685_14560 [Xanthomonas euvesicatoria]KLA69430.1 hypothetical protein XEUV689_08220 [Xanthomonas euvesicatoria]
MGGPAQRGEPFMPRKPLVRAGDVVQVQGLIAADRLCRAPTIARKGRQAPSGARRGARTATRRVDAARRPPQGSRGRPRLIHSQRAALPVAVGDSSTYPQASGKLCGQGWAGLPIAGRPRLVHGARPKAGCAGRFRPPGAARTVGKTRTTCPASLRLCRRAAVMHAGQRQLAAEQGKRSAQAACGRRRERPVGPWMEARRGETRAAGLDAKHDSPTRSKA